MATGFGVSVRVSETIGQRMMYAAVPVQIAGGIAGASRVALALTEIDETIGRMHRSLAAGALVAILVAEANDGAFDASPEFQRRRFAYVVRHPCRCSIVADE